MVCANVQRTFPRFVALLLVFALLVGTVNVVPVLADYDEGADYGYSAASEESYGEDDTANDAYEEVIYSLYEGIAPASGGTLPDFNQYSYRNAVFRLYGAQGLELDGRARYPHVYTPQVVLGDVADLMGAYTNQVYGVRVYARYHHASARGHVALGNHIFNYGNSPYPQYVFDNSFVRLGGPGAWHSLAYLSLLNDAPLFPTGTEPSTFSFNETHERIRIIGFSFLDVHGDPIPSPNPPITLQSLEITRDSFSVIPGYRTYMRAIALPLIATNRGMHWSSSDTSVVYITNWNGHMITRNPGVATIRVTNNATGLFDEITVTVVEGETVFAGPQFPANIELYFGAPPHDRERTVSFANAYNYLGANALNVTGIRVYFRNRSYGYVSPLTAPVGDPSRLRYSGAITRQRDEYHGIYRYFFVHQMGTPLFTQTDIQNNTAMFRIDYTAGRTAILGYTFINANGGAILPAGAAVTSVSIVENDFTIEVDDTENITAVVLPNNAENQGISWSSSDTSVATVVANGALGAIVTGEGAGTATITVTTDDGGFTDSIIVTVEAPIVPGTPQFTTNFPVYSNTPAPFANAGARLGTNATLVTGIRFYAIERYTGHHGRIAAYPNNPYPNGWQYNAWTWTSHGSGLDSNVYQTNELLFTEGHIASGSAAFWIRSNWNGPGNPHGMRLVGYTFLDAAGNVVRPAEMIEDIAVESVEISDSNFSLGVGQTRTVTAVVLPLTASNRTVTWESSNSSAATISDAGVVTAVSIGTATLTVTTEDGGFTDSVTVNVVAPPVQPGTPQFTTNFQLTPGLHSFANAWEHLGTNALLVTSLRFYFTDWQYEGHNGRIGPASAPVEAGGGAAYEYRQWNRVTHAGGIQSLTYLHPVSNLRGQPLFTEADLASNNAFFQIRGNWFGPDGGVPFAFNMVGYTFLGADGNPVLPASDNDPVTGVSILGGNFTLGAGGTRALSALVAPITAGNRSVTWVSSNTNVASVSATGVVTAISGGTATITVTTEDGGYTDSVEVTVNAPVFPVNPAMRFALLPNYVHGLQNATIGNVAELMGSAVTEVTGIRLYGRYPVYGGAVGQFFMGSQSLDFGGDAGAGQIPWNRTNSAANGFATLTLQWGTPLFPGGEASDFGVADMFWGFFYLIGFSFIDAAGNAIPTPVGLPVVTSVEIDHNDFNLFVDVTRQLSATVLPVLAPNRAVTWTSSDPSVATVSATGLVTGVSFDAVAGYSNAVITAQTECGVSDTVTVTVVYGALLESPQFPVDPSMYIGMGTTAHPGISPVTLGIVADLVTPEVLEQVAGIRLYAVAPVYGGVVGQFAFGDNLRSFGGNPGYTPWDRSTQTADGFGTLTLQWNDPLFANGEDSTFGVSQMWWGFFRLMGFSFLDVNGYVLPALPGGIVVTSVTIEQPDFTMMPTGTRQLSALVLPALASDRSVTWTSSNPAVASVSATGLVTALTIGETTITAETVNGLTDTVEVTVVDGVVIDGPQFPANYVRNYNMVPRQLSFANAWEYLGENALQVTGLRVYVTNRYPGFTGAMSPVNPDGSGPSGSDRGMALNSGVFQNEGGHQFAVYQNYEQLFTLANLMANRAYFRMDFFWRYITIVGYTFINEFGGVVLPAENLGPQPVASVIIDGGDLSLTEGGFADIVGIVLPLAAANRGITWASSDQNVATIEPTGNSTARITAINAGTATITVTTAEGGFTDSIEVTVSAQEFDYENGVFTPVPPIRLYDLPDNDEFIFNVGRMLGDRALDVAGVRLYAEITGPGSHGGSMSYGQRHTFIAPGNYGPHATRWGSTAGDVPIANGILPFSRNYTFFTQENLDNDAALFFVELWWASSHQLQISAITFLNIDGNVIMLGETVNRTALASAIEDAEALVEADFTPISWAAFQLVLQAARNVYNNATATQTEIDNARTNLLAAMAALVPVPTTPEFVVNPPTQIGMGSAEHPGVGTFTFGNVADLMGELVTQVAGMRFYAVHHYSGATGQMIMGSTIFTHGGDPDRISWNRETPAVRSNATLTLLADAPLFPLGTEDSNFGAHSMWWGSYSISGFSFLDVNGNVIPAPGGNLVVTSVEIEGGNLRIMPAQTRQLSATVLPVLAADRTITWASSNEAVATISATGLVTAIDFGTTTITATAPNGIYDTITVEVVDGVVLDGPQFPADIHMHMNNTPRAISFANAWYYLGYNALDVTGLIIYFAERDNFVGAISPFPGPSGNPLGQRIDNDPSGNYIRATGTEGSMVYQTGVHLFNLSALARNQAFFRMDAFWTEMRIVGYTFINETGGAVLPSTLTAPQPLTEVFIDDEDMDVITVGDTHRVTAVVLSLLAQNREVVWTSSNNNIATVTATGLATANVTGTGGGVATITVTTVCETFTDSITVTVAGQEIEYDDGVFTYLPPVVLGTDWIIDAGYLLGENALQVAGIRFYVTPPHTGSFGGAVSYAGPHHVYSPGNNAQNTTTFGTRQAPYWDTPIVDDMFTFSREYLLFTQSDLNEDTAVFYISLWWSSHPFLINRFSFLDINGNPISPALPRQNFSLHAFNNGVINNPSLANGGTIRIWTQLDGGNALVPHAGLTVTATLPNGESAMQFVNVNRPWNNQNYVNFIDVNMHAPWQRIYLTATLNGQVVELTLINPRFFSLHAFNNGVINNQSLANSGIIRIWTQLMGANALVPNSLVVTAVDQDNNNAMHLVRISEPWANPGFVNLIDVNFDAPWQRIYFTATVFGQTVELVLVNPRPPVIPEFSLHAFNNGTINNQSLANAGIIRIWTRLDGANALVPNSLVVTAVDQDNNNAMHLVRINEPWANPGYVNLIDVNFNAPWQRIYLTATVLGQTVELVLVNPRPPVVPEFSLHAFNNGIINNQSLANAGIIRIWTRLDGANTNVLITQITAVDQDGNNAMEHLRRINTVGVSPQNGFDVNFNAPWQRIYLTVTAYGQTFELTLVNPVGL